MKLPSFIFTSVTLAASSLSAQDLSSQAEELADSEFYRRELIEVLYGDGQDYKSIFKCETILNEKIKSDGGIDATCATDSDVLHISTSMGPGRHVQDAYVCPVGQDKTTVRELISLSFEATTQRNGTLYNMGYTDGWLDDFVNRLFVFSDGVDSLACWDLGRR
jgi:hypothetical protein